MIYAFNFTIASYNSLPEHIITALFLSNGTTILVLFLLIFFFVEYKSWSSIILATIAILSVSTVTQRESPGLPAPANFQHLLIIFESDSINNLWVRKLSPIIGTFAATECSVQGKTNCKHKDEQWCKSYPFGLRQLGKALKIIRQWQ